MAWLSDVMGITTPMDGKESTMGGQAFDAPRSSVFNMTPEELVIVGIDVPDRDEQGNPHFLKDERVKLPLNPEFIANVMALGVKENIIITKIGEKGYVIDGRQRVRAAREANIRLKALGEPMMRVPCTHQKGEHPLMMLVGVSTNEFHHSDDMETKARKAQRLRDRGLSEEEIAVAFGVTTKALQNWEKALELSSPVKEAVSGKKITMSAALQLHGLSEEEQKEQLGKLLETAEETGKAPTIKAVKAAKATVKGTAAPVPSKKVLRYLVEKRESHKEALSDDFIAGIAFAIGMKTASDVTGLEAVLENARKAPAKKKQARNDK